MPEQANAGSDRVPATSDDRPASAAAVTSAGPAAPTPRSSDPTLADAEAPMWLAHTDWLGHRLTVCGPAEALASLRSAASGAGIIPWVIDLDRVEEDWFHLLMRPDQRRLSAWGARVLAGQLREAVERRHALATARVGHAHACPFDLHALLPVPEVMLARGPDDPVALAWLWQCWGTTQPLRHVTAASLPPRERPNAAAEAVFRLRFWSADWTPWRALATLAARWPALRFEVRPSYDDERA